MTMTALEICMVAIQLGLCMQLGILCIQLSHLYSAPTLLENEKNSRKKKGRKAWKGEEEIEEDKKKRGKKEMQSREKGREEKKKSDRKKTSARD